VTDNSKREQPDLLINADSPPPRILVVDDQESMCEMLADTLGPRGYEVHWRMQAPAALQDLRQEQFDAVLTDLKMPDMDGIEFCKNVHRDDPGIPVVVMTAFGSLDAAMSAIRAGAFDFVTKPLDFEILDIALQRAVHHFRLRQEVERLKEAVDSLQPFGELLGESPVMQRLYRQLARVANVDTTVLITGESGSGKELAARSIHQKSKRQANPFVAINCAALPESLMESELFGHEPGAFTGAEKKRDGLFVQANGGTLFLDEIGEMSMSVQPKLLRALEENRVRPIGSSEEVPFDVRLIAATNRDLETAVEEGRFREDLFYRINVININLPPLRTRGADILLLAQHSIQSFAQKAGKEILKMSAGVAQRLLDYNWPGNVRELRNAMERAIALTDSPGLAIKDLPEAIRDFKTRKMIVAGDNPDELRTLEEVERRYILHVVDAVGGNKTVAAQILGLDRKTLYRKLNRYENTDAEDQSPAAGR
jgi:two-component system response regulator HydG